MDHRDGGRQINLPAASAGASEEPAGTGEKPSGASEKPAGAGEKPAGAGEKPAGASEKPSGAQKDTASGADLPEVGVGPIVVPAERRLAANGLLAVEIDVQTSARPRNV